MLTRWYVGPCANSDFSTRADGWTRSSGSKFCRSTTKMTALSDVGAGSRCHPSPPVSRSGCRLVYADRFTRLCAVCRRRDEWSGGGMAS